MLVDTIVVTARKLEEDPRNVPFGVSSFDSQALVDRRIDRTEDLFRSLPNVSFSSLGDGRSSFFAIRGAGPIAQPLGYDDTSVVTYIDGVPQPLFGSDIRFLDVARIEVLRGPQGTVFGRNAQAGAVSIITRQPGDDFTLTARGEIGSDRERLAKAAISGPIAPGILSVGISGAYARTGGDVTNDVTGRKLGDTETKALRGSLVGTPDERTRIVLTGAFQQDENTPSNFVLRNQSEFPRVALEPEGFVDRKLTSVSLTASREIETMTLTSVTAYHRYRFRNLTNNSEAYTFEKVFGLPAASFVPATDVSTYDERQRIFYQELRLNSHPGSVVDWVVGGDYYWDTYKLVSDYYSAFFPSTNGIRHANFGTRSLAVFGEATSRVPGIEGLKASLGLRYTNDRKHYDSLHVSNGFPGTVPSYDQSGLLRYDMVTGRFSLNYAASADTNIYATVARGAKSGGFPNFTNNAPSGLPDEPYRKSTTWGGEVGTKNRFFDGRLEINAALFFNDVKNENLFALDSASFTFVPKPIDTRSYGAELEIGYRLGAGFDLIASGGYTHAEVRKVSADVAASSGAVDGNRVPGVPRLNSSVTLQYKRSIGNSLGISGFVQHQHVGRRAVDVGEHFWLPGYDIVNARLGVERSGVQLYVYGRNLTDARPQYIGIYYGPGAETVTVGHGRVIGVGASYGF